MTQLLSLRRVPSAWCTLALAALGASVTGPLAAQQRVEAGRSVAADGYVRIWNGAGSLRVEGWDVDSLAVTGTAPRGAFFLHGDGQAAKVGLEGNLDVLSGDLVVRVPRSATVWIRTTSASITVRGLTGSLDVYSVTGAMDVAGRPAHFFAESMAGDLTLAIQADVARARTGAGRIRFTGAVADLSLATVGGFLEVEAEGLRRGRFTTVEGNLTYTGDLSRGGFLEMETHSGDARLTLPPSLEADFELSTFKGQIRSSFGDLPERTGTDDRRLSFSTGAGQSAVVVRSFSGDVVATAGEGM